jgi:site-specific recombinase XerD
VRLNIYLDWLYSSSHLSFDPQCFRHKPKRLSQIPESFLESLTTIKPSSRRVYKSALSVFHRWLEDNGLAVTTLQRHHMTRWFNDLNDRGLHPETRLNRILCVRVYLRWAHEQGVLRADPEDLIRASDLPPRPSHLPRPLPPDVDHELQLRLAGSECPYQQGLLLMRNTGLRVGELMSLELNCVREDYNGNRFLKVPLGKLDNERLVPIDDETFNLIGKLQHRGRRKRRWLLESPTRKKTQYVKYTRALRDACKALEIPDKMTTHRLRHSYATSLLNGGMSLVGVMRLLGHRDYRMTLRYTAITQETIVKEYYEALVQTEKKYSIASPPKHEELDPARMLSDITRWLNKNGGQDPIKKRATRSLIKRIERIQTVLQDLMTAAP